MTADQVDAAPTASTGAPRARVLTLWRPWTTLVLSDAKPVENRGWSTNYRGPLVIHGGARFDDDALSVADALNVELSPYPASHPKGHVGVVDLVDICTARTDGLICGCGPWAVEDECHWRLANPRTFTTPIEERGQQGIWVTRDPLVLVSIHLSKETTDA